MVNNFLQLVPEQLRDVLVCVCEKSKADLAKKHSKQGREHTEADH